MTIFGWIIVALFTYLTIQKSTDIGGRVFCLAMVLGVLVWGTGNGL